MAGNEQLIDSVIDPAALKQVDDLTAELELLQKQLVDTAKAALQLNNITATSSTSFSKLETNSTKSSIAVAKVKEATDKAAIATTNLEKAQSALAAQQARTEKAQASLQAAQERAKKSAEQALSPYAQLSKQLDQLRAKAKDVGVEFGENSKQFKAAAKPVQELDERIKGIDKTLGQSQRNVGNYGNALTESFSERIPFFGGVIKIHENLKKLGEDFENSGSTLGKLGVVFGGFTTAAFVAAIGAATYYLEQFRGTGNKVDTYVAGLKQQIGFIGELLTGNGKVSSVKDFFEQFNKAQVAGEQIKKLSIELENSGEVTDALNKRDQANVDSFLTQAENRKKDYQDRLKNLNDGIALTKSIQERSQKDADLALQTALKQSGAYRKLRSDELTRLKSGDLEYANELANSNDKRLKITEAGYQGLLKAFDLQTKVKQQGENAQLRIEAVRDNLTIRDERELAQAQDRLDKAKIQSALDASKLILESDTKGYQDKIAANKEFIDNSLKLLQIEKNNQLAAAGVPGRAGADTNIQAKNRAAIEQENLNAIAKVRIEGQKNLQKIVKDNNALYEKDNKDHLDRLVGQEKDYENQLTNLQNDRLQDIAKFQADQESQLAKQYVAGKISRVKYNDELKQIDNAASQYRIRLQIETLQKIIAAESVGLLTGSTDTKELQSNANKLSGLKTDLTKTKTGAILNSAQAKDDTDKEKLQEFVTFASEANKALDLTQQTVNSNYERQIELLQKKSELITDNARVETDAINRSLDTESNKRRRLAVLDAQTASAQKAIVAEENRIKTRQAKFDKAISIAKITEETAVAIVSALAIPVYGEALAIVIGALGAAQLAIAASTPVPTFEKGGTTKGGGLIWGEKGTELAIEPSGKSYLSPDRATFTTMPAGTKIIPHDQLMKPKHMNGFTSTSTDRAVVNAINNNTLTLKKAFQSQKAPRVNVYVDNDFANYSKRLNR